MVITDSAVEAATPSTAYQEIFRAIGRRLDREGWHAVLLMEEPSGLALRGTRPGPHGEETSVLQLTPIDLYSEVMEARRQRGQGAPAHRGQQPWGAVGGDERIVSSPLSLRPDSLSYQERMRAVGWFSDRAGLRHVWVREDGPDLIVEGWRAEGQGRVVTTHRLTPAELERLVHKLMRQRRDAAQPQTGGTPTSIENFHDIAGYEFAGPYERGFIPHRPGVYLVLYGRGHWYLLDVDHADDVPEALGDHPRAVCWDRLRDGAPLAVALYATAEPRANRAAIVQRVRRALPQCPCC